MITATVAYFIRGRGSGREILLGIKTKKLCKNKRLGPGGKRKSGETYRACVVREIREEVAVEVAEKDLHFAALIDFNDMGRDGKRHPGQRVAFYLIEKWEGSFIPNSEIKDLRWFRIGDLPVKKMTLGDPLWFHLMLEGYFVSGSILYKNSRRAVAATSFRITKSA